VIITGVDLAPEPVAEILRRGIERVELALRDG
jgi:hypothetical protein